MNKQEVERALNWAKAFQEHEEYARDTYEDTCGSGDMTNEERKEMYEAMESSINLFKTIASALQQQLTGGWIPVSSQIPERNGWYIVCDDENSISIVEFRNPWSIWYRKPNWDTAMEVIAWMPLPEPWKGEADETT